jgi:hypothetical protein
MERETRPVVDDLLNEADANAEPAFAEYLKKILAASSQR